MRPLSLFTLVAVLAFPIPARANDYAWTGGSGTWSVAANWSGNLYSGGIIGTVPTGADGVYFNQSTVNGIQTISLDGDRSVLGLTFLNTSTTTLQSDSATPRVLLQGASGILVVSGSGAVTIGSATNTVNVSLDAAQSWINNSSNAFTVLNGISLANAGAQSLSIGGSGGTTLSGPISDGAGTLSLVKAGNGTLSLATGNTYTGTTSILGGTLQIAGDTALGTAPGSATVGAIVVDNTAGPATLSAVAGFTLSANRGIALGSSTAGTGGTINVAAGTLLYGGIIANNGGANSLSVTGSGTLQLSSASSYTGGTRVAAGTTLLLGDGTTNGSIPAAGGVVNNGTFNIRTSGTAQSFAGVISGSGSVVMSGSGTGVVTLSGASTYTGTTSIGTAGNAAVQGMIVTGTSPLGASNMGAVTVFSGGTGATTGTYLQLGAGTTTATVTGKTLTLNTGTYRAALLSGTTSGTNTWAGNIVTVGTGSAQIYNNANGGTLAIGTNATNTITGVTTLTFRGNSNTASAIVVNSTINFGTRAVGRTDSGATVVLNNPYNVWATTGISLGRIRPGVNEALPPNVALSLGQANSASATFDLNGRTQTVAGLSDAGATGTSTTFITSVAAGGVFTLNNTAANTFGSSGAGGTITGGANLSLVKMGPGSLTINSRAVNTYTGSTTVYAGALTLDFVNLATPTNLIDSGSPLILGGGTYRITAKPSTATSQTVNGLTVNPGGSSIVLNNAVAGTPTVSLALGAITRADTGGTVAFTIPGGGSGISTTTGNVNGILGGWATVGNDWAVGGGGIAAYSAYTGVTVGNTITSGAATNVQISGAGPGGIGLAAAGTTDINTLQSIATTGTVTYTATTGTDVLRLGGSGGVLLADTASALTLGDTPNNGILTAGGADNTAGSLTFWNNAAPAALTVNLTIADNGTGAVTLNKAGAGSLVLNGTNTYTGGTNLGGGTLSLGSTTALGNANGPLTLTGGTLDLNGNALGVGNLTGFGGTIQSNAPGAVTLTIGNNNATGGIYRGVIANGTGTVSLVKTGTGTLTLAGNNTYTGTTSVTGTLQIGADTATGTLGTGAVTVNANSTLAFNRADTTYSVPNDIGGAGGVNFIGRGTVTLTSGNNTYAGGTTIRAGTLALSGGNNRLPATTLAFGANAGVTTYASWFDIGSTNQTLSTITFPQQTMAAYFRGTGTLTVNGNSDLNFGPPTNNTVTNIVDMSGLSRLVYNSPANTFRVGVVASTGLSGSATNQNATVTLASDNTITAALLAVSDQGANSSAGLATLYLGATNTINVADVNVGFSNRSGALLTFAPGLTNPTVTFRNTDGTSAVNTFAIGRAANVSNNVVYSDSVDFSLGTVDLLADTMTIGAADTAAATNRTGTTNGSFTLGAGTVNVATLNLGRISNSGGGTANTGVGYAGNGTFTINNPAGTLNAAAINLATNTITTATSSLNSVSGTLNLTDGLVKATAIQRGPQTGTATNVTVNLNWTTGTLQNTDGANLTITNVPVNLLTAAPHTFNITGSQTGTVAASSVIGGVGGLTKTGTGTLTLAAANTYTGPTAVIAGTLNVSGSLSTGAVAVNGGATLGGTGTVGGPVTVNAAGILRGDIGSGMGTLNVRDVTVVRGGSISATLGAGGTSSQLTLGANTLTLSTGSRVILSDVGGFVVGTPSSYILATTSAGTLNLNGSTVPDGFIFGTFVQGTGNTGPVDIDTSSFTVTPATGDTFTLSRSGPNLVLSFSPVPEPSMILGLAAIGTGFAGWARRRRTAPVDNLRT